MNLLYMNLLENKFLLNQLTNDHFLSKMADRCSSSSDVPDRVENGLDKEKEPSGSHESGLMCFTGQLLNSEMTCNYGYCGSSRDAGLALHCFTCIYLAILLYNNMLKRFL